LAVSYALLPAGSADAADAGDLLTASLIFAFTLAFLVEQLGSATIIDPLLRIGAGGN